jgi:hypothetical protein
MKKKTFQKFIAVSISLLILLGGVGWACGWFYDEDEANYSLFAPEVIHNTDYQPFFRSFHTLYEGEGKWDNVGDFNLVNIQEWKEFFQSKVDTADLNFLLYKAQIKSIDSLIFFLKRKDYSLGNSLKKNTILNYPDKSVALEFLYYIGFALRCEPYAAYVEDMWGEKKNDNPRGNVVDINKLIDRGTKAYVSAKSDFICQRYLFQLVRLHFYGGYYDECVRFYSEKEKEFTLDNSIKYRSMGYAAGALYRTKQYAKANYLYSKIYDHSSIQKISAYLCFHPVEESDWQACLSMAQTQREKNVLWHLLGIYADPLRAMTEIYKTEPASDLLDLLLVRAVNIAEEKFVPLRYYEGGSMNDSTLSFDSKKVDPKLFDFVCNVADKGNTHKPAVWNLAAGYFYLAAGNCKKADKYLEKALKVAEGDKLIAKQASVLQIVNKIERSEKLDKKFENKILSDLQWLRGDSEPGLRNANAYEWALKRLAEKYDRSGNYLRAECLDYNRHPHFYSDTLKAAQMMAFMDSPNKTEFEKYILTIHPYKKVDIIDFQAVQLAYQDRFKEALAKYQLIGSGGGALLGDPFVIHINDCHDCDHADSSHTVYTKASFLERMLGLQKEAAGNTPAAAKALFLLANGYYNMTYFGNARAMYETAIPIYSGYNPFDYYDFAQKQVQKEEELYNCTVAEKYYRRAMDLSNNKEFKAKCCFMASKCEQNRFFMGKKEDDKRDFQAGVYFRRLKSEYSKTNYYQEIIRECGYFRTFLGMN